MRVLDTDRAAFDANDAVRMIAQLKDIAGEALDREARWSSDGNQIYFLSDRDGFRCIWQRNLNPATKQPSGPIHPLLHLHDSHLSLRNTPDTGNVTICPVGNKLIFAMGELNSDLWMTDLTQ